MQVPLGQLAPFGVGSLPPTAASHRFGSNDAVGKELQGFAWHSTGLYLSKMAVRLMSDSDNSGSGAIDR